MTLRYPTEIGGAAAPDYVEFVPMEYKSNQQGGPGGGGAGGAPGRAGAQAVILYMPNSTPPVGNVNNWGDQQFAGPIGEMSKQVATSASNLAYGGIDGLKERLTKEFNDIKSSSNLGGVAQQAALRFVGQQVGTNASQLLALSQGKVYNPNVELLYTAPGMRSFDFSFTFVPKNSSEAQQVNRIIKNFKKWSAPADLQNGMFEVPHVWQVKYMTGGKPNPNMNKFKKAACTSVTIQANPQTSMHVAHEDGMPIETSMSLSFREVDIIVRGDHDENGANQGY